MLSWAGPGSSSDEESDGGAESESKWPVKRKHPDSLPDVASLLGEEAASRAGGSSTKRKRTFAHVDGQWPSHVYLSGACSDFFGLRSRRSPLMPPCSPRRFRDAALCRGGVGHDPQGPPRHQPHRAALHPHKMCFQRLDATVDLEADMELTDAPRCVGASSETRSLPPHCCAGAASPSEMLRVWTAPA